MRCSWALLDSTPEGTGKTQLDAPEGMTIASGRLYVVDTANHRIVAFDTRTLEKVTCRRLVASLR